MNPNLLPVPLPLRALLILTLALLPLRAQGPDLPELDLQKHTAKGRTALRAALGKGVQPPPAAAVDAPASHFRRGAAHPVLERLAKALATEKAQQEAIRAALDQAVTAYDEQAKDTEFADDLAGGVAVLLFTWHSLATGEDLSNDAGEAVTRQLQAACKTDAVAKLGDADKQAVHEWAIGASATLFLVQQLAAQSGQAFDQQKLAAKAGALVADAFGVAIERIHLDKSGLRIDQPRPSKDEERPADQARAATTTDDTPPIPEPEALPTGTPGTWQDYAYLVPEGWTQQVFADAVMLQAQASPRQGELTWICLFALRKAEADLGEQAVAVAKGFFGTKVARWVNHTYGDDNLLQDLERGVTGDGFPYVEVNLANADEYGHQLGLVRVVLFRCGDLVAPVVAFDNGLRLHDPVNGVGAWIHFWYGLSFPKQRGAGDAGIRRLLTGKWGGGSGTYASERDFGEDGSYGSAMGYQTERDVSATTVKVTTHGFFAEGRYVVRGNRLAVWPKSGRPFTNLFRVVEQRNRVAATGWVRKMRQLFKTSEGKVVECETTHY